MKTSRTKQNKLLAASLLLLFFALGSPACFFYNFFGLPCPGCGMTRALLAVLQGDLTRAWQNHPLFILLPLLLVLPFILKTKRQQIYVWSAVAALFLLVYIIRLILIFPGAAPFDFNQAALLPRLWRFIKGPSDS